MAPLPKFQSLFELLEASERLPYGLLYLQGEFPWTGETLGVIYPREVGSDLAVDQPEFVAKNDLKDVLDVGTVKGIVFNAKRQLPDVSLDQLVAAFNYYYKHDAPMKLKED